MTDQTVQIDHKVRGHARLSASRIPRVALCPGSLLAEEALPPEPSGEAAARGTAIHELAEVLLTERALPDDTPQDLLEVAMRYVAEALKETETAKKRYVELDVTPALKTIHPSLGGTADLVAVGGGVLTVCDLKTGRVDVDPQWNPQLLTYALGAAIHLKAPPTVQVRLCIYQPESGGWKEWSCYYADLMDWKESLIGIANMAMKPDAPRNPSAEACKYCRAKVVCPKVRAVVSMIAAEEFKVNKENVADMPPVSTTMLDEAELCMIWADAVQTAARAQLAQNPEAIVGWRLKEGRRMKRWKDSKMAMAILRDHPEAFDLKSVSSVEKLGIELPTGLIEETRAAASLARVK